MNLPSLPGMKSWGKPRRASRVFEEAEFNDDLPPGFMEASAVRRASDTLPDLSESETAQLDAMLERNGLKRVLKTLRVLCDSRHDPHGCSQDFETLESTEQWLAAARELETFLQRDGVNAQ